MNIHIRDQWEAFKLLNAKKGDEVYRYFIESFIKIGENEKYVFTWESSMLEHPDALELFPPYGIPEDMTPRREEIEKILSTFKFLDETANWQTYRNKEYGFELKHPGVLSIEPGNKEYLKALICDDSGDAPAPCLKVSVRKIDLESFIKEWNSPDPLTKIYEQKNYILDGEEAIKMKSSTALGIDTSIVFAEKNNKNYILYYFDTENTHNQILSTFKFLDENEN